MALVICAVLLIDLMRRRMSRVLAIAHRVGVHFQRLLELVGRGLQLGRQRVAERLFLADLREQLGLPRGQELRQLGLELLDPLHRHVVHVPVLDRPDHGHLDLDGNRVVLRLLEDLHDALAAVDLRLRLGVEVRAELRERRQFAELREVALELPGDLLHRLELRRRADARDRDADRDRRADALVEQVGFQIRSVRR